MTEIRNFLNRFTQQELRDIADRTGVTWHALQKIRTGAVEFPRLNTVLKIQDLMREQEKEAA